MSSKQVADFLGLHTLTVLRLARQGKIPAFKIKKEWRFYRKHIQRWLKERSRLPRQSSLF